MNRHLYVREAVLDTLYNCVYSNHFPRRFFCWFTYVGGTRNFTLGERVTLRWGNA